MSKGNGFEDVLTIGVVAGGAYLIWNWWQAQLAQASASTATAQPVVPPAVAYTPPTVTQQMQTAANANSFYTAGNGMLDADQWSTIWNSIGQPAIPANTFDTLFFPNGRPADASQNPTMSLATFMQALSTQGLSGVGGPSSKLISVPIVLSGKRTTMQVPASTTPAQLQTMLRNR